MRDIIILLALIAASLGWTLGSQRHGCRGELTACKSNLKNIGTALDMYFEDHKRYPASSSLLTPNYLKTIPTCAGGGRYEFFLAHDHFQVICAGCNHRSSGLNFPDYPRYNDRDGLIEHP